MNMGERRLRSLKTREGEGLSCQGCREGSELPDTCRASCTAPEYQVQVVEKTVWVVKDKQEVLRCGGRLSNAGIPCETANLIFLKRTYHTHLIVKDCHERMEHGGVSLAELRGKYWVVQGQQLTK